MFIGYVDRTKLHWEFLAQDPRDTVEGDTANGDTVQEDTVQNFV
jgi:hypothetical protein